MAIVPNITGDNGPAIFGGENFLYLVLNSALDEDLLPQIVDFSIDYQDQSIAIQSIDFKLESQKTYIVLLIDGNVAAGKLLKLVYKPTDWFMCDRETGDSIEPFEEQFLIHPLSELPAQLKDQGAGAAHKADTMKVNAALTLVEVQDIQISIEAQLDITIAPRAVDFSVVQAGRVFDIAEIAYVKGQFGPDIYLTLRKPLTTEKPVVVEYNSAENYLQTVDGNAIADFSLSARLESSSASPTEAQESGDEIDTWVKFDAALVKDEANDSDIYSAVLSLEEEKVDLAADTHDVDEELLEVDELIEQFEIEVKKSVQDETLTGLRDEEVEHSTQLPDVESYPEELDEEDLLLEEQVEEEPVVEYDSAEDIEKENIDVADELLTEPEQEEGLAEEQSGAEGDAEPIDLPEHGEVHEEQKLPDVPVKTKVPLSWTARVIYLIPIIVFVWLLVVGCVFVATMVYDIDLSFSGGNNVASNSSAMSKEEAIEAEKAAKRKSCKRKAQDGGAYDGQCVDGLRDGHGVYTWPSGNRYIGEWSLDRQNGKGTLILTSGAVYEGEFRSGLEHGQGKMTWPNGAWYEGEYEKGKFHGNGVYMSSQGNRYEGVFKNGSMTKNGTCVMKSGKSYFGPCKSGG